jgi:hypothetical protein
MTARQGVHQFHSVNVRRIDTLREFADAVGVPLVELVAEKKQKSKSG